MTFKEPAKQGGYKESGVLKVGLVIVAAAGLAGFSPIGWRTGDPAVERCLVEYEAIDSVVQQAGVADSGYARIDGFPYFRIDRFLASYDFTKFQPAQKTEWIGRLVEADKEARAIEIGNLPAYQRGVLFARLGRDPMQTVEACAETLRAFDHQKKEAHQALPARAKVTGEDPAPARPTSWSKEQLAALTAPRETTPDASVFAPAAGLTMSPHAVKLVIETARTEALRIPQPKEDVTERLIAAFAPVWVVNGRADDALVLPEWREGKPATSPEVAAAYTLVTNTKFKGQALLQINYVVWFKAQPVDGLIWRVTIGPDGRPLAYDSIRTDGSGYLLLAGAGLGAPGAVAIPEVLDGDRVAVTVDAGTRTITHVGPWSGQTRNLYVLTEYDRLLRLYRSAGETHSLFGPEGVLIPGGGHAPRQWGHHKLPNGAYFDSPTLFEKPAAMASQ